MRTKSIFLAAVLLLSGGAARAQQAPWSLTDCISYALEHNLTVQQSAIKVEQQEVELSTAQGRRLPTVNASASENFSFGRGLTADNTYSNSNTTSTSFQLGGSMPIFQGFDINNGIKLSKLNLAAADIRIEAPIPGKAAVGIEIPNKKTSMVRLRELIDSDEFRKNHSRNA